MTKNKIISKREGLIIYWCEGDKSTKGIYKVAVTSTDCNLLRLYIDWLTTNYDVERNSIKLRLHLWEDLNENKAKQFWSNCLNISINSFTKTYIKKKGGRKKIHVNGVCRASIQSKKIHTKIIQEIKDEFYIFNK